MGFKKFGAALRQRLYIYGYLFLVDAVLGYAGVKLQSGTERRLIWERDLIYSGGGGMRRY